MDFAVLRRTGGAPVPVLLACGLLMPWLASCCLNPASPGIPAMAGVPADQGPDAFCGLAYRDLGRGGEILWNADTPLHAASTMKIPVMIEVFRQADAGRLSLDEPLVVVNEFASLVDGSAYSLDPDDDSDRDLYGRIGERVPVRELVHAMIRRSSNLATNLLIAKVGAASVQRTVEALGAGGMQVLRGVEDGKAFRAGRNNTTTARALLVLLEALARGTAASATSCEEMLDILAGQELDAELIPAGLPPGTRVAHKTGHITGIRHDAAVVFPDGAPPYVLVVLTSGFADEAECARWIAALARDIHRMHLGARPAEASPGADSAGR